MRTPASRPARRNTAPAVLTAPGGLGRDSSSTVCLRTAPVVSARDREMKFVGGGNVSGTERA